MDEADPGALPLTRRWVGDLAVLAPGAGEQRWVAELELLHREWSARHRAYHTLQHLTEMVAALDALVLAGDLGADDARTARLAAWYHDLAYDPRAAAGSNEHRSAALARDHLHRLGVEDHVVDLVESLVLMTIEHDLDQLAARGQLMNAFHDADLWILAAPADRYDRYVVQVRQEYAHVPQAAFTGARSAILRGFAARERLYRSPHAAATWEAAARSNIRRELRALGAAPQAQRR